MLTWIRRFPLDRLNSRKNLDCFYYIPFKIFIVSSGSTHYVLIVCLRNCSTCAHPVSGSRVIRCTLFVDQRRSSVVVNIYTPPIHQSISLFLLESRKSVTHCSKCYGINYLVGQSNMQMHVINQCFSSFFN